jgi:hypothetical protein
MNIYELVDATNDEMYYPLAIYLTMEDALKNARTPPDVWNSDGYIDDYAKLEIRERPVGWSAEMIEVKFIIEWENLYDEEIDENRWEICGETHDVLGTKVSIYGV